MSWKFADRAGLVAVRTNEDGSMESVLASALPEGSEIAPFETPAEQAAREQREANERALAVIQLEEAKGLRRMRETILKLVQANLPPDDPDRVALEHLEARIAAERAKLRP